MNPAWRWGPADYTGWSTGSRALGWSSGSFLRSSSLSVCFCRVGERTRRVECQAAASAHRPGTGCRRGEAGCQKAPHALRHICFSSLPSGRLLPLCCHPLAGSFVSGSCPFVPLGNTVEDPTPWFCPGRKDLCLELTAESLDISAILWPSAPFAQP